MTTKKKEKVTGTKASCSNITGSSKAKTRSPMPSNSVKARLAAMETLLFNIEWTYDQQTGEWFCPSCRGWEDRGKHGLDCDLRAALYGRRK